MKNNLVKSIFLYIAKKFGFELQPKTAASTDFYDIDDISITATLSDRLSTLTLMDSGCDIVGDNKRALYLQKIQQYLWSERIKPAMVVALGTGDCLLKPSTDGKHFAIDIISNDNFQITESIGDFISGIVIKCDEFIKNNSVYERIEYHKLKNGNCHIYQMAYKNGKEIPLSSVNAWSNLSPEIIIPNVERLDFGRIKCPTLNRSNFNSVDGVPITFGAGQAVKNAKDSYNRFNQEFDDKETLIFATKSILHKNPNTNDYELPKGKKHLFHKFRGIDDSKSIETYSPDIRDSSLQNGLEVNLKMIETICGLSNNILTKPDESYTTATEIRTSLNQTYAFITELRTRTEQAINDLMYSINTLCNVNQTTPMGEYDIVFTWSDKLMESSQETFNQLLQLYGIGGTDAAEVRAWTMGEDLDDARQTVEMIESKEDLNVIGDE